LKIRLWVTMKLTARSIRFKISRRNKYGNSSELFRKVSNGDKVFGEGVKGSIPGFSFAYPENPSMFIKGDMLKYYVCEIYLWQNSRRNLTIFIDQLTRLVNIMQSMTITRK
jgi:hypothetical protein